MKWNEIYVPLQVISRKLKDNTLTGYTTIISAMGRESTLNEFAKCDLQTQCLIVQWFDYSVLYIDPAVNHKSLTELVLLVRFDTCELNVFHSTLANWLISMCLLSQLQELNDYLAQRSYLVGQSLSLADVVVFYSMCAIMDSLNPSDKEKYLNVSRWYEHIQKMGEIRQNLPLINLSTIYLHGWATGTHI